MTDYSPPIRRGRSGSGSSNSAIRWEGDEGDVGGGRWGSTLMFQCMMECVAEGSEHTKIGRALSLRSVGGHVDITHQIS